MEKKFIYYLMISMFLLLSPFSAHAAETFTIDSEHTYVLWHIQHLGFSTQAGKWYAKGSLTLDKEQPQNSKVNVTIKVADVITGIPELDKHLRGKVFFDTKKFPTATFKSDSVEAITDTTAIVKGTLTLRGVSKPISLNVKLNQAKMNPFTDKMTVGFSATTELKRSDFGMKAMLPALGDEVKIEIEVEAYKSTP